MRLCCNHIMTRICQKQGCLSQGGPTNIPENLTSATSLLRYGGNQAAFGAADMDSAADLMPAVSSSITLQKAGFPLPAMCLIFCLIHLQVY